MFIFWSARGFVVSKAVYRVFEQIRISILPATLENVYFHVPSISKVIPVLSLLRGTVPHAPVRIADV